MKKLFLFIALLFFTCLLSFAQTRNLRLAPTENPTNEKRKAVVIGMSNYGGFNYLPNTIKDAEDMTDVFRKLGFFVTQILNEDPEQLNDDLNKWYNTIENNDMAVFYFSGHGMEIEGINYLIPINYNFQSLANVKHKALNVSQVIDNMDERNVRMKLIILDACRSNDFKKTKGMNSSGGLASITAPKGTFIAFAASPGKEAADGGQYDLKNGVFTHFIKQELIKEGMPISAIFTRVANGVDIMTDGKQTPFTNSSLTETFFFIPRTNPTPNPNPAPTPTTVTTKYYYYIDQNGNESPKHFDSRENAMSAMKSNNLYGKIYSNMGEVFIVDKPAPSPSPQAEGVVINGVRWATRNVGTAPHTFAESPESYGGYYQWNRGATAFTENWNGNNTSVWGKANDPCPAGWRLPTSNELQSLKNAGNAWTTRNGVNGYLFGSGSNTLFLPAAGRRSSSGGSLGNVGTLGYYWSSAVSGTNASSLYFFSSYSNVYTLNRAYGFSVRCVAE